MTLDGTNKKNKINLQGDIPQNETLIINTRYI